jgi:hypothetical protein
MVAISDAEMAEARLRWDIERAQRPIPVSVRFDPRSSHIVIEFTNTSAFTVPARALQGLEQATDAQLADVELLGETGLHWDSLDVDYTVSGLMNGVFGSKAFLARGTSDQ